MEKSKTHTKISVESKSKNVFDKEFNPKNWPIGKGMSENIRLRALIRKCQIKNLKFGNFQYCIVLMEHQGAFLIKGAYFVTEEGLPLLTSSFWISKPFIEIERVLDDEKIKK